MEHPGNEAHSSITAHHLQRTRGRRARRQPSIGRRREDSSVGTENFVRPRSQHDHRNNVNLEYSSHQISYGSGKPNDFPLVTAEYQYIDSRYPTDVELAETQIASPSTSINLMDSCPINNTLILSSSSFPVVDFEHDWCQTPSNGDGEVQDYEEVDAPPSPTAQRYIKELTPEERMRLGLPRFQSQQEHVEYIRRSATRR
jgi:hypothetical protein